MNQIAKPAVIAAVGDRPGEWRDYPFALPAGAYQRSRQRRIAEKIRIRQGFSAELAYGAAHGSDAGQAFLTDRQARDVGEGGAAETAIRGEQRGEKAFGNTPPASDYGGNQRGRYFWIPGLEPNWVRTTAEDEPPPSSALPGALPGLNVFSITGVCAARNALEGMARPSSERLLSLVKAFPYPGGAHDYAAKR